MQIIRDIDQLQPEWFSLRLASIGSTAINKIAPGGVGFTDTLYEFAGEAITGVPADSFKFQHADRGHEFEPQARRDYEFITDNVVEQITMIQGEPRQHVSTDGIIGEDGILEIKTRIPKIFIKILKGKLTEPIADRRQRDWGLHVSGRKWVDSVNYCPEIAKAGRGGILIKRFYRDEEKILELKTVADKFLKDLDELLGKI